MPKTERTIQKITKKDAQDYSELRKLDFKRYKVNPISTKVSVFNDIILPKKSEAVKIWNDRTIKKLIFLVLIMNGMMTIVDADFYSTDIDGFRTDIQDMGLLYEANFISDTKKVAIRENILKRWDEKGLTVLKFHFSDGWYSFQNTTQLEKQRNSFVSYSKYISNKTTIELIVTQKSYVFWSNLLTFLGLVSIIINVLVSYYFFTKGADTLVLNPLNSIVKVINTILKRPLDPNINSWYLSPDYRDRIFTENEKEYSNVVACICRISLHLSTTFG